MGTQNILWKKLARLDHFSIFHGNWKFKIQRNKWEWCKTFLRSMVTSQHILDLQRWKYHRLAVIFDVSNFLTNLKIAVSVPIERVMLKSTPNLNSISVISGTPQTFTCYTKQQSARYQWYRGNRNITTTDVGGVKLVTFQKTDNGSQLKCRGWNRVTKSPFPESAMAINVLCKLYKHLLNEGLSGTKNIFSLIPANGW